MTRKLADVIETERAETPPIEVCELADGTVVTVDAPALWPDSVFEAVQAERIVQAARGLLGDQYDAYAAEGGTAALLFAVIKRDQGVTIPESKASTD